jgi:alkaline phosphatase
VLRLQHHRRARRRGEVAAGPPLRRQGGRSRHAARAPEAGGRVRRRGFPKYDIQPDGYPATFDVDGKILIGYGADGDRFENWLTKPLPVIDSLLTQGIRNELKGRGYAGEPADRASDGNGYFVRGQAVGRGQAVHTASDIPISAYSTGSRAWQSFVGVQTNTDVFFTLMQAVLAGRDED